MSTEIIKHKIGQPIEIKPKVLKSQTELKAVPDAELRDLILQTYRSESRHGHEVISEKGDAGRKNLWVTDLRRCPREVYYKFYEPSKAREYTEKGLVIFADGKLHHKDLQWRLEHVRLADHPGGYLKDPELGVTGYYDDLVFVGNEDDFKVYDILEIKTKLSGAATSIDQADYDQDQYYQYMAQFSDWLNGHRIRIRGGRLAYKDKSHMSDEVYFCYRLERDDARIAEIRNYFRWLKEEIVDKKQIPSRPYEYESTECTYCLFRDFCWQGIVIPSKPAFIADESTEPPEQELVDSMASHYLKMREAKVEAETEMKKAEAVLMKYFKATGQGSLAVADKQIMRSLTKHTELDGEFLFAELSKQTKNLRQLLNLWKALTAPKASLIQQAIKDGKIDAGLFEQAKHISWIELLRVKKNKEE